MITTKIWAEALKVETNESLDPVPDFSTLYARSARQVTTRAVILQGVTAVACEVDSQPVVKWFQDQRIWQEVTSKEQAFLLSADCSEAQQLLFRWQIEAESTLLWMIGTVETLGLPTRYCDTRRLVDEIIPALDSSVTDFIDQAELRPPGALLAEDDRTYNLWCYALAAQRRGEELPNDLNLGILRERRYAFEWMDGNQVWDEVTCDA